MFSKLFALLAAACTLTPAPLAAQSYPSKPITLVVPFAPGGSVDAVARVLKPHLEARLGQPLIIEYRGGAATTIGTGSVARAPADGYTVGIVVDAHTVNPSLYKNLSYNTFTDFASVSLMGTIPLVIAVNAKSELDTLQKLVAAAKADPKKITYATVGSGSINHLAAELFSRTAGIEMTHVPYRGGGPAVNDLLGGHVGMMFMSATLAWPQLQAGTLRAIAVTSEKRLPVLPNVPTVSESGFADFKTFAWQGMLAPAKTPPEIVERLQRDTKAVLAMPEVSQKLTEMGFLVVGSTAQEFTDFIRTDADRWAKIVADSNIKPDN
jgi:tripartite-type tricarboxylate transporter receptor subunit TctC